MSEVSEGRSEGVMRVRGHTHLVTPGVAPTLQALERLRLLMILLFPTFGRPESCDSHMILHVNHVTDSPTTPTTMLVLMSAFLQ